MATVLNGCRNFWWTEESRYSAETKVQVSDLTKLRLYDLAFRITFLALLAVEIAGFALLAVGCKTPPPFHPLIGLYVCVGALFLLPTALAIINCRREAYCKTKGINADNTHFQGTPAKKLAADLAKARRDSSDSIVDSD